MPIKCDDYGHACVIAVTGDFLGPDTEQVCKLIEEGLTTRRAVNFVVDFESSRFIGSEGLEALLAARRRCEERRGRIILAGLDDNLKKIFQITRLDRQFESHPDATTALKAAG